MGESRYIAGVKRVLPTVLLLVPLGCRGEFDLDKYLIADGGSESAGSESSGSESESSSSGSEITGDESESTGESTSESESTTDSESSDTDVDCAPAQLDIGSACISIQQTFNVDVPPTDIALADFDKNTRPDLLIAGDLVTYRLTSLDGQFGGPSSVTGASGRTVAVGDYDDGWIDFATFNDGKTQLIGNPAGTFVFNSEIDQGASTGAFGMVAADLSTGLLITRPTLRLLSVSGGMLSFGSELSPLDGKAVDLADLDNDGFFEIGLAMTQASTVAVFPNNGGVLGVPDTAAVLAVSDVKFVDLDGNGQFEFLAVSPTDNTLAVFGIGPGLVLVPLEVHNLGTFPVAVAVGDIDGDDLLDVAVANSGSHDVSILLNDGSGGLTDDEFRTVDANQGDVPTAIAVADLGGDGFAEIVVSMLGSNRVVVYGQ